MLCGIIENNPLRYSLFLLKNEKQHEKLRNIHLMFSFKATIMEPTRRLEYLRRLWTCL